MRLSTALMWWDMGMSSTSARSYRPGAWFAIAGERALVVLPPTEKARVGGIWELLDEGAGFDVTLDALIAGGLRDLPGFVLVSTDEGRTDVVIRGEARATFVVGAEEILVEGSAATTWVEKSLEGVEQITIVVEPDAEVETSYAVDAGVFRVSRFEQVPSASDRAAPVRSLHVVADPDAAPGVGDARVGDPTVDDSGVSEVVPLQPAAEAEAEAEAGPDLATEVEVPVASPNPPAWTPAPPGPILPPMPGDAADAGAAGASASQSAGASPEWAPGSVRLEISSGESVEVDRVTIIGRAPETKTFPDLDSPRLVRVPSAHYEISSAHLEIRPADGGDAGVAVVTDLGSTNGTVVVLPGFGPRDLAPGEPLPLTPGALIDIGDGITIQVVRA